MSVNRPEVQPLAVKAATAARLLDVSRARVPDPTTRESELVRRVTAAVERAHARQGGRRNAAMTSDELDRQATLDADSTRLLTSAANRRALSARAVQSLRRVARTCADLDGAESVQSHHVAQALALRASLS